MWKGVNGVNKQTLDKIEGENQEWIIRESGNIGHKTYNEDFSENIKEAERGNKFD
jgi:hypothetical protein